MSTGPEEASIPLTVVALTYDEELNLPALLESTVGWVREVFVVDSGSTDSTTDIAEASGATVVRHPFESHRKQWKWALETLPIDTDWVLGLDADQRVSPELKKALTDRFSEPGPEAGRPEAGLYVRRRQIFRGSWIKHGGYYPKYLLKLFDRHRVYFDPLDLVDHHFYVNGPTERLPYDIVEENLKENDISFWIEKHNRYAARHAREELARRTRGADDPAPDGRLSGSPDERTLWLKRAWSHLPLYVRPVLYFFVRYVIRLGFLDGKQGFVFHVLHGFWYRLLVDVHLDDLRREADEVDPAEEVSHRRR